MGRQFGGRFATVNEAARFTVFIDRESGNPKQMAKKRIVTSTINGKQEEFLCRPRQTLLEVLRDVLELTGTKEGCSNGNCGACTVLLDGRPVDSCLVLAVECEGARIETIEGVARAPLGTAAEWSEGLDVIQQAFLTEAALQCGICTPGFIVTAKALLNENPRPTEQEIRFYLAGNLCRCTGYDKIVRAVQEAAERRASISAETSPAN